MSIYHLKFVASAENITLIATITAINAVVRPIAAEPYLNFLLLNILCLLTVFLLLLFCVSGIVFFVLSYHPTL